MTPQSAVEKKGGKKAVKLFKLYVLSHVSVSSCRDRLRMLKWLQKKKKKVEIPRGNNLSQKKKKTLRDYCHSSSVCEKERESTGVLDLDLF